MIQHSQLMLEHLLPASIIHPETLNLHHFFLFLLEQ
jgi:hypothetical protein